VTNNEEDYPGEQLDGITNGLRMEIDDRIKQLENYLHITSTETTGENLGNIRLALNHLEDALSRIDKIY
jgi:hypothetical protein